jgi:deoxycytidylate deaminase/thymidylate synthase
MEYLQKELAFYLSGSLKLSDALKASRFWSRCSDDGKTINSNYGKLLFHDINDNGNSQYEYVFQVLSREIDSKKAVATIYRDYHGYFSNDNPCTMYLHFIVVDNKLQLTAHMRSNDIWYGVPYDVPFFCALQIVMYIRLSRIYPNLQLGSYTHIANNLHMYEKNREALVNMYEKGCPEHDAMISVPIMKDMCQQIMALVSQKQQLTLYTPREFMRRAWMNSELSQCKKKKVGAVLVLANGVIVGDGFGGREGTVCKVCDRDLHPEMFHGDSCYSVHAEMRAIKMSGMTDLRGATMYTTHGPCDACLKLMNLYGISNCIYDIPYKNCEEKWPTIDVRAIREIEP